MRQFFFCFPGAFLRLKYIFNTRKGISRIKYVTTVDADLCSESEISHRSKELPCNGQFLRLKL